MTALMDDRAGLGELRLRLLRRPVASSWYVLALLTMPVLILAVLILAVLMHASYTGWLQALFPATSFEQGLAWQTALAFALWLAVAVVICVVGRRGRPRAVGKHRRG